MSICSAKKNLDKADLGLHGENNHKLYCGNTVHYFVDWVHFECIIFRNCWYHDNVSFWRQEIDIHLHSELATQITWFTSKMCQMYRAFFQHFSSNRMFTFGGLNGYSAGNTISILKAPLLYGGLAYNKCKHYYQFKENIYFKPKPCKSKHFYFSIFYLSLIKQCCLLLKWYIIV